MLHSLALFLIVWAILVAATERASGGDFTDNLRASVDISSRLSRTESQFWSLHAVGLDVHKVFAGDRGDIGTLTFQPYVLRIDGAPSTPSLFDDNDDTALQWRIANFNYTALGRGRINVRMGHFELPFGLEHVVPTNGTLHQMNSPQALGLKADWGVSLNGDLPWFEYEVAAMRGAGNDFTTDADGIVVGRVGSNRDANWRVGVSLLKGETGGAALTERRRAGLDAGLRLPHGFVIAGDYATGKDDGIEVGHLLTELGWWNRPETTFGYLQWRRSRFDRGLRVDSAHFGFRYEPNRHWSTAMEFNRVFDEGPGTPSRQGISAQLRYRL